MNADALLTMRLDAWLPQTQCTRCGYPRCHEYAAAMARGDADINRCPPGGEVTLRALASIMDTAPKPLDPAVGAHEPRTVAVIDEETCIGCRKCLDVCPVDAILGARKLMHTVLTDECNGCGLCVPPCPMDCIAMPAMGAHAPDPESWPEYAKAETARWRERTAARLARLARKKQPAAVKRSIFPNRDTIQADIRAALARTRERNKNA